MIQIYNEHSWTSFSNLKRLVRFNVYSTNQKADFFWYKKKFEHF